MRRAPFSAASPRLARSSDHAGEPQGLRRETFHSSAQAREALCRPDLDAARWSSAFGRAPVLAALALAAIVALIAGGCGEEPAEEAPTCISGGFVVDCGAQEPEPEPEPEPEEAPPGFGEREVVITWESFEDRPCPPDSVLSYANFGQPFMLNWCTGCHSGDLAARDRAGAPVGVDLDTLRGVRDHAARIWARSADDNLTMPPVGTADATERFLLGEWLACGAP